MTVTTTVSTTVPARWPLLSSTGVATRANTRPPTVIWVRWVTRIAASMFFWCAGFLWKMSMLEPTTLSVRKSGSALRKSFSALRSMPVTAGFMKTTLLLASAIMTLLVTACSA